MSTTLADRVSRNKTETQTRAFRKMVLPISKMTVPCVTILFVLLTLGMPGPARAQVANDACLDAEPLTDGVVHATTDSASADGNTNCAEINRSIDVWYKARPELAGWLLIDTRDSQLDTVVSVHRECPGNVATQLACNDDDHETGSSASRLLLAVAAGTDYYIRVSGHGEETGAFRLDVGPGGTLSGRLIDAEGSPLAGVMVELFDLRSDVSFSRTVITDSEGRYAHRGLPASNFYALRTRNGQGFLDQVYPGVECAGECDLRAGDLIAVTDRGMLAELDFTLRQGATISGRVVDAVDGTAIPDLAIVVQTVSGDAGSFARTLTDAQGFYRLRGLASDTYVVFTSFDDGTYQNQIYDGVPCAFFICDSTSGVPVEVVVGESISAIDFALTRGASGGIITGHVTRATDGIPLTGVEVSAWRRAGGLPVRSFVTGPTGHYRFVGLPSGRYVVTTTGVADDLLHLIYNGKPCIGGPFVCDRNVGNVIEVQGEERISGIDLALETGGSISGRVRVVDSEETVAGAQVTVQTEHRGASLTATAAVGENGAYRVSGLSPGTYQASLSTDFFYDQVYDGIDCRFPSCDVHLGTAIEVTAGDNTAAIDFTAKRIGAVAGTVIDAANGRPLPAHLEIWNSQQQILDARADANGRFQIEGIEGSPYYVIATAPGYLAQVFAGQVCAGSDSRDCDLNAGTEIFVPSGEVRDGVDFALGYGAELRGELSSWMGPVAAVTVRVWNAEQALVTSVQSDQRGRWAAWALPAGTYRVVAEGLGHGFVNQIYDGIECVGTAAGGFCDGRAGTPITVVDGQIVTGLDFRMRAAARIQGRVVAAVDGRAVDRATVRLWRRDGTAIASAMTNDNGFYQLSPLARETYVLTVSAAGFRGELYDDLPCPAGAGAGAEPGCDLALGTPLDLSDSETLFQVEDIALADAGPTPSCVSTPTAPCLNRSRFRVEATWRTPDGHSGAANGVILTSDSAYFWFFIDTNVEMVVKLLDGCVTEFGSYWFFAAGLTNVEVDILVTDTLTGEVRRYRNEPRTPFQPILDTAAFAACP